MKLYSPIKIVVEDPSISLVFSIIVFVVGSIIGTGVLFGPSALALLVGAIVITRLLYAIFKGV